MTEICAASRLAAVLGLLALVACATQVNPATGRREVLILSTADEEEIQEKAEEQLLEQYGPVHHEALAEYVAEVGNAIAVYAPRKGIDYRFQLVEMEDPNAFALPAGGIYVSRSLLLLMNSEAELANVLAHEIAHVAARHAAQQHAHQTTFGLATLLSDLASGSSDGGGQRESLSGPYGILAYGRNQEREADRIGQDLVVAAGIDPSAMSRVLRTLQSERRRQKGYAPANSYLLTHPASIERIAETATRAQIRDWQPRFAIAPDRASFLARLDGVTVGRPASEGVIRGNRLLHPELGFSLRFPPDWKTENANAYVMAVSPQGDTIVTLFLDSRGDDPLAAARAYAVRERLRLSELEAVRIGELSGARARAVVTTPRGPVDAELTWIAWDERIYRLVTGRRPGGLRRPDGFGRAIARTFRPLSLEDRAEITELRVRVVVAREGETLEDLSRRSGNEWDLHQTASLNGLVPGAPLEAGFPVKIARRETYRPRDGT